MNRVDLKGVVPIDQTVGEDEEDTALLRGMANDAAVFLMSFAWCRGIRESYFGDGVGGIAAIFLFWIEPAKENVDEWLWVVVGDIPPAYLVTDVCKSPSQALEAYMDEMSEWVVLAKQGQSSSQVIPVPVPATPENARILEKRISLLREIVLPRLRDAETERA